MKRILLWPLLALLSACTTTDWVAHRQVLPTQPPGKMDFFESPASIDVTNTEIIR